VYAATLKDATRGTKPGGIGTSEQRVEKRRGLEEVRESETGGHEELICTGRFLVSRVFQEQSSKNNGMIVYNMVQ
jgi:hypothetical protein